jgi:hypothetical protein
MRPSGQDHGSSPPHIDAFFSKDAVINPVTKQLVLDADLIIGLDTTTGQEYVVYGKAALKRISTSGQPEDIRLLHVAIDAQTDDLDRLCGLVMALRGRFDYGKDWEDR